MQIFHASPDRKNRANYEIDATHEWKMPGVNCSQCGQTWATVGVNYPLVDLYNFPYKDLYQPWPVSVERYRELRELVKPLVPDDLIIPPGTEFGPLIGKAKGKFGDFIWLNPWTLLVSENTFSKLLSSGISLPGAARPKINIDSQKTLDYLEFQIEPLAVLSPKSFSSAILNPCSLCGRVSEKPEKFIVDVTSIPLEIDIFRIRDFPTYIIVSERFADLINQINFSGIMVTPVDIG